MQTGKELDKKIRRVLERNFRLHGKQITCLTQMEFQRKWSNTISDLSDELYKNVDRTLVYFGDVEILLTPYKEKLLGQIAWISDERYPEPPKPKPVIVKPMVRRPVVRISQKKLAMKERLNRLNRALARIEAKERETNGQT
jgi:hypothetical protein